MKNKQTSIHSLLCYGRYTLLSIIKLCYNIKFLFTKNNILNIIMWYIWHGRHKKTQTQRINFKIYGTFLRSFSVFKKMTPISHQSPPIYSCNVNTIINCSVTLGTISSHGSHIRENSSILVPCKPKFSKSHKIRNDYFWEQGQVFLDRG